ncbi:MAG TPA: hypothetical protein VFA60_03455 [Terriglobales bacterium]|nr:hypothetical protein [Terriglobales bacterium]
MQTRVIIQDEIRGPQEREGWRLAFQKVRYVYADGEVQDGYRFIWYRPDGSLQPARGQARIPSLAKVEWFLRQAERKWGKDKGAVETQQPAGPGFAPVAIRGEALSETILRDRR